MSETVCVRVGGCTWSLQGQACGDAADAATEGREAEGAGGESSPSTRQDADARFGFKVSRSPAMPLESLALYDQRPRLILAGSRHKLMTLEVWEEEPEEARAAVRQRGG